MRVIFLFLFVLLFLDYSAQWPALSTPNVPITSQAATTDAARYWAAPDNVGGSFVVWEDDRNDPGGKTGIFCQRMQSFGVNKFVANGIQIADVAGSNQKKPWVADGNNSTALICWEDERNTGPLKDDIYAKCIDSIGLTKWGGANGILICNATDKQEKPQIVSDGTGGGIIVWRDKRNKGTTGRDIYAQRVNSAGVVQWTANGIVICNAIDKQTNFNVIPDGNGGAIVAWEDDRSGSTTDIYAQKINSLGVVQWTANGVPICINAADDQLSPVLTTDGSGGAIIAWEDLRNGGTEDIYAQRINSLGTVQWTVDGIIISNATDVQASPTIASDESNGAVIIWEDDRNAGTTDTDIYAQRVNSTGIVQWAANGVVVCNSSGRQRRAFTSVGNYGSVLVTWEDKRPSTGGKEDIYLELIASNGTMIGGTANGTLVCSDANKQKRPFIFKNGTVQWIVVWEDDRNDPGGNNDIYSQGLDPTIIIALPIELVNFNAVQNNKVIELNWTTASESNNDFFTIERSKDGKNWEEVIFVEGAGNSNKVIDYFEIDPYPLSGLSYYRLKQTDFNGEFTYSNIVPVNFKTENQSVEIFPNPNDGTYFNIKLDKFQNKEVLIIVRDITGKELYSKVVFTNDNNNFKINFENKLPKGTYLIIASSENDLVSKKLIVE